MTYQEAVAKRLRELTEEKGITQAEIVEKTRLSRSTVSRIFSGRKSEIKLNMLFSICRVLNVVLVEFFHSPLFDGLEK